MTQGTKRWARLATTVIAIQLSFVVASCATLEQVAALRQVRFDLDGVAQPFLAGVDLERVRGSNDLRPADVLRLTSAISRRELPLTFTLLVGAENPADNKVTARMVQMDWTLFLDDRETISGVVNREMMLTPGTPQQIPVDISVDLVRFFGDNLRDLVELALAVSGQEGGVAKRVMLRATPTINTPIGPIRYPEPITIVSRTVGS